MNIGKILYDVLELILFASASLFVANTYLSPGPWTETAFGLFLLWIFIDKVSRPIKGVKE